MKTVKSEEADAKRGELIGKRLKSFHRSISDSYIETRRAVLDAGVNDASANNFMTEAISY